MDKKEEINHRKSLFLAFLAYEGVDQEFSKKQMNQCLENYYPWIGRLLTVWGPAYHRLKKPFQEDKVDSMAFVVKDSDNEEQFYIVIRGTNPLNLFEWVFQDFWVGNLVAWNQVPFQGIIPPLESDNDTPAISFGTNIALTILLKNLKDPSSGVDLITFLQEQAQKSHASGKKMNLYLTGHSLGGVIASILALFLEEKWSDKTFKPDLLIFSYAGPTTGNQQFASYYDQMIGERCLRYANDLDVVTRVWNRDNMEKLPSLYQKPKIEMPHLLLKVLCDLAIPAIDDKNYSQMGTCYEIPSKVVGAFPNYITQMAFQHLIPYFKELIRLCPESDTPVLLRLMDSWDIFDTLKNMEPFVNIKKEKLQYYLGLLE
jgi:hypothetical protein